MDTLYRIENSVYEIPLKLPVSLEIYRTTLRNDLINAQRRIREFSSRYNWIQYTNESFAERAEIFESQNDFIDALFELTGMDRSMKSTLPNTVSAALENRVFMSISPRVYSDIFPQGREEKAFEKLIAHEMAHRLHIRILNGNEEAMGPIWFYEGFAIVAAGQFETAELPVDQVWEMTKHTQRGSYRNYAAMMHYFLEKMSLPELVIHAGTDKFESGLKHRMHGYHI